jgi:hypothetical protein
MLSTQIRVANFVFLQSCVDKIRSNSSLFLNFDMSTSITNAVNGKRFGTIKFQYSKYSPVDSEGAAIVPKDKQGSEHFIALCYCQFLKRQFQSKISSIEMNNDDSNHQPDVFITENDSKYGVQITQFQLTNQIERNQIAKRKNLEIANKISQRLILPYQLIINIFPVERKDRIPLIELKRRKTKIETQLLEFIIESIKSNSDELATNKTPIWISVSVPEIAKHFARIVLNPIPNDSFSRFPGKGNISVNYDIDDIAYDEIDIETEVKKMYLKKMKAGSKTLIIWADDFGLFNNKRVIANKLGDSFFNTNYEEICFITFTNNKAFFLKSLEIWPIKTKRMWPNKNADNES